MGKRLNGEGMIRERANGLWEARLRYVDDDGTTKRESFYGKTKNIAADKLKEARKRIEAGDPARDATVTVSAWCETWRVTSLAASARAENTKRGKETRFRLYVNPAKLGRIPLAKLKATHVEAWLLELRSWKKPVRGKDGKPVMGEDGKPVEVRRLSEATIVKVFYDLAVALDGAVRDRLLARNPVRQVDAPVPEEHEARFFTDEEAIAVLNAAKQMDKERARRGGVQSAHYPFLAFVAATGVRKGEAIGLKWEDVNFETGVMQIRGTKSKKSNRPLDIDPGVTKLLRAHRKTQRRQRRACGSMWVETGYVFTSATGTRIDRSNALRMVKAAAKRAGVQNAKLHAFRHSAATTMLANGIPLADVSAILGHSRTSVTADVYAHAVRNRKAAAMGIAAANIGL